MYCTFAVAIYTSHAQVNLRFLAAVGSLGAFM